MEARPSTARPEEFDEFDTYTYDDVPQGDRTTAAIAHFSSLVGLSLLVPIVIYALKRDESEFVAHHAREALNFQLSAVLAILISIPLIALVGLGVLTMIGVIIATVIYSVVAGVRALDGDWYDYPFTVRFLS